MSISSNSSSLLRILAILAVLIPPAGIWYLEQPFSSLRPPTKRTSDLGPPGQLSVQARLWQDPLEAVRQHEQRSPTGSPDAEREVFEALKRGATEDGIDVMPVFVPGNRYQVDHEGRLRARYAVLAALDRSEFTPDEWDRIQYFKLPWPPLPYDAETKFCAQTKPNAKQLLVPYEWFSGPRGSRRRLLVLWIDDTQFYKQPLEWIARLIERLGGKEVFKHVRVIGPTWSSVLKEMFEEASTWDAGTFPKIGPLRVYAPWATLDSRDLLPTDAKRCSSSEPLSEKQRCLCSDVPIENKAQKPINPLICSQDAAGELVPIEDQARKPITVIWRPSDQSTCIGKPAEDASVVIYRTIAQDSQLIEALVAELEERGVEICRNLTVALISEWDTAYGQLFVKTYQEIVKRMCGQESIAGCDAEALAEGGQVGQVGGQTGSPCRIEVKHASYLMGLDGKLPGESAGADQGEAGSTKKGSAAQDDIERPSGQSQFDYLRRLADRLAEEGEGVQAVGLLGSDVFDKLLVLEALSDRLPHALFFTTDLDAYFLHPSQRRWTRNLVVAAGFGLQPPPNEEECLSGRSDIRVAPFRDSYQTAMFEACRSAVKFDDGKSPSRPPGPSLFEIGRTRLIPLVDPCISGNRPAPAATILLCMVMLALLVWLALRKPGSSVSPLSGFALVAIGLMGPLVACYGLASMRWWLRLFEGGSIWPSVVVQAEASIFSAVLLALVVKWTKASDDELRSEFCLEEALAKVETDSDKHKAGGKVCAIWGAYVRDGSWQTRWWPALLTAAICGGLFCGAMACLGWPAVSYHGDGSRYAAWFSLLALGVLQLLLTCFTVRATWLCCCLVWRLTNAKREWPPGAAERWGCAEEDADEALAIELVGKRTKLVRMMNYCVLSVIVLVILSRNQWFERSSSPTWLLVIEGSYVLATSCGTLALWWLAERLRARALAGLHEKLLLFRVPNDESKVRDAENHLRRLNLMIDRVRSIDEGAFAPLSDQLLFYALLPLLGGVSLTALLNHLGGL